MTIKLAIMLEVCGLLVALLYGEPTVVVPDKVAYEQFGGAVVCDCIGVGNKDVLSVNGVCAAVANGNIIVRR